jgi:hypothetical protein
MSYSTEECPKCNRLLVKWGNFRNHIFCCKGRKDLGKFECQICQSLFHSEKALVTHIGMAHKGTRRSSKMPKIMTGKVGVDYVICPLCQFEGKSLRTHFRQKHGTTIRKLKLLYPDYCFEAQKWLIRNKFKGQEALIKLYGVTNQAQVPGAMQSRLETNIKRYGCALPQLSRSPYDVTKPERFIIALNIPQLVYTGNRGFFISMVKNCNRKVRVPDFIVVPFDKTRAVVEFNGQYFHKAEDNHKMQDDYDRSGVKCLMLNETNLCDAKELIDKFIMELESSETTLTPSYEEDIVRTNEKPLEEARNSIPSSVRVDELIINV